MYAKKHLGQHFLKDKSVVNRILDAVEATENEAFLEIGPGPATLTAPFSDRGFPLTVVEYDKDMVTYLRSLTWSQPLEVIQADFMDVDLSTLIQGPTKVFSNLPYNVSVPITARLLHFSHHIPLMVMMYQKEVAIRIRSANNSRDYGPISILCALFYEIDWHMDVKPGAFHPPPKVMSQVMRFRRRETPLLDLAHLDRFSQLVRFLFNHRRKMIGSNLKKWTEDWTNSQTLLESLNKIGLQPTLRPENLSVNQYVDWFHEVLGVI